MNKYTMLLVGKLSIFVSIVLLPAALAFGDITYSVVPVTLNNPLGAIDFHIAGGTITTDGTTGAGFGRTSIIDYEIAVTGPFNFTFRPTNTSARIHSFGAVMASETEIFIERQPQGVSGTAGPLEQLRFESRVVLDPLATFSNQQIAWSQRGAPFVDSPGVPPERTSFSFGSVSAGGTGGIQLPSHGQGSLHITPALDRLVIASIPSSVPEPGSVLILLTSALLVATRRRRT